MRAATSDDFDLVYDTYMDETVNPFMWNEPMDKAGFQSIFDDMMGRDYFWILKNSEGVDCGMVSAVAFEGRGSHIAEIQSFGIQKASQGQGLGKKTMEGVIAFLKGAGFKRLQLGAEADNPRAIALYKDLGFEEEGRQEKFLSRGGDRYVDEILMGMTNFN